MGFQRKNRGFSLIELIVTIIVVGIVATYAIPRLDLNLVRNRGFFDLASSSIRYGQKRAIATGCTVEVNISSSACNLTWVGCAGNAAIGNPVSGGSDFCQDSAPGGGVSNGSLRFDSIGRPMTTSNIILTTPQNITIGSRTIRVESQTGYVYEP